jgi:predicted ATPase/DNA-binding winged helix-turn-helix (wHTH) protein
MKEDARMAPTTQTQGAILFGPFSLVPGERLLINEGVTVQLGARTLDTLIALISRPNEVVSKNELMAQVWPDVTVDEGSLRFHMASLRKALGDGKDGARYIATLSGRGYSFVAPISRLGQKGTVPATAAASFPGANLPNQLMRMIGREDDVRLLSAQLPNVRFVTIVGAGGVGKTTVAVAVGHDLIEAFVGAVLFVDLGALSDPDLVAVALASMLGLQVQSNDPTLGLIAHLRDKTMLLILDTCEHLIDSIADLAGRIFIAAPQIHILATSREALRVEGEHVYRLAPLAVPQEEAELSASDALRFSANRLFVERAGASGASLDLSDADAALVTDICRRLDGLPLAIELAASRVEAYGLQQTAMLLERRLSMLWRGQRTAPPRQKTLHATLDWSFGLLSTQERVVLRGLAVFVGHFTLEAALFVVPNAAVDEGAVFGIIDSLIAKSMVSTRPSGAMMRYRLLDTTRTYALEIGIDDAEQADLAARHATYCRQWLEQTVADLPALPSAVERMSRLSSLNNVRAALEWCFSDNGNADIGVKLAAAAAPVFLAMSLIAECRRWSEQAILTLDDALRGGREEMYLQAALGMSTMFTRGSTETVRAALERSLAIAEDVDDARTQLRLLSTLNMFHGRIGDLKTALQCAKRASEVSRIVGDPAALALAHALLGLSLQIRGDLTAARAELEAARQYGPASRRDSIVYLGFDGHKIAGVALARTLWLQGYPDQALQRTHQTVKAAAELNHPVTLSIVLIWAVSVFLWAGDEVSAEKHIDWFLSRAESFSLGPYVAVGRGFKAQLAIRNGEAEDAIESLQASLAELRIARYQQVISLFDISLAQGLEAVGRFSEGIKVANQAIERVEERGELCYLPELLRVKGSLLHSLPQSSDDEFELCLVRSLELSRRQGARAWELRTAADLAASLAARGQVKGARALLQPVLGQFAEGLDTADLKSARRLLTALR